jgi:hypothetical protein
VSVVVEQILAGPRVAGLLGPFPAGTTVRGVDLADDGVVFVDLALAGETPIAGGGSLRELLTVYSLVNSIVLNSPVAERVVLLLNGKQNSTFAGHIDTARPLAADLDLIASSP